MTESIGLHTEENRVTTDTNSSLKEVTDSMPSHPHKPAKNDYNLPAATGDIVAIEQCLIGPQCASDPETFVVIHANAPHKILPREYTEEDVESIENAVNGPMRRIVVETAFRFMDLRVKNLECVSIPEGLRPLLMNNQGIPDPDHAVDYLRTVSVDERVEQLTQLVQFIVKMVEYDAEQHAKSVLFVGPSAIGKTTGLRILSEGLKVCDICSYDAEDDFFTGIPRESSETHTIHVHRTHDPRDALIRYGISRFRSQFLMWLYLVTLQKHGFTPGIFGSKYELLAAFTAYLHGQRLPQDQISLDLAPREMRAIFEALPDIHQVAIRLTVDPETRRRRAHQAADVRRRRPAFDVGLPLDLLWGQIEEGMLGDSIAYIENEDGEDLRRNLSSLCLQRGLYSRQQPPLTVDQLTELTRDLRFVIRSASPAVTVAAIHPRRFIGCDASTMIPYLVSCREDLTRNIINRKLRLRAHVVQQRHIIEHLQLSIRRLNLIISYIQTYQKAVEQSLSSRSTNISYLRGWKV